MTTVIHWFRRDLRLDDNTAFLAALEDATAVVPLFILDDTLLKTPRGGGGVRVGFMVECLHALDADLRERGSRLVVRRGPPADILYQLAREYGVGRITYNRDYSPYAHRRDAAIGQSLRGLVGVRVESYADLVLNEFDEVKTNQGTPYHVYSPYFKRWQDHAKTPPQSLARPVPPLPPHLDAGTVPTLAEVQGQRAANPITESGEQAAQIALAAFITEGITEYAEGRNRLDLAGTSRLSPHLRWGTISIRRCYTAAQGLKGKGPRTWIQELAWRDFYQMILAHYPQVITRNFRPKYDQIQWGQNEAWLGAWAEGRTGYPVVDAAMRQLRATGWMHNRARMIVASFLCKDLLLDWRRGERFFMQHLIDGDTAANNGGWQWAAGTGTDAAPYFRIFNPTAQGEKHDPNGDYVRQWVPELRGIAGKAVHQPWKHPHAAPDYPAPIVDHAKQREKALEMYAVTKTD